MARQIQNLTQLYPHGKSEPLIGLSLNAVRTLLKNVFIRQKGMEIVMVCPGIGPAPAPMPIENTVRNDFVDTIASRLWIGFYYFSLCLVRVPV